MGRPSEDSSRPCCRAVTVAFRAVIVGCVLMVGAIHPTIGEMTDERLELLLTRLDRSAAQYSASALTFSCTETIRWEGRGIQDGRRRFNYVVTLDDQGVFADYRILARKHRRPGAPKRVEPRDYGVPTYLRSAYLWSFIFKRERWPRHRYEIVGEEEVYDRAATVIRFEPIPPYRVDVNNWFGTAWVDRDSAQLLKVTARRPEDEEQLRKPERHAAGEAVSDWTYVIEEVTTEFTVEERGLRYPRRVDLRQRSFSFLRGIEDWRRSSRTILEVTQIYSDYRFFVVEATTDLDSDAR